MASVYTILTSTTLESNMSQSVFSLSYGFPKESEKGSVSKVEMDWD
jgi:hypothetical protein